MPKLPAQPRPFADGGRKSAIPVIPEGNYLAVLVAFPDVPMTTSKGDLLYLLKFEVVSGEQAHQQIAYFIRSDIQGLPTLEWRGEGRWRELLKAFGLNESDHASIDTSDLMYRPARVKVTTKNGKNYASLEPCTPDETDACLDYVERFYPLQEAK